VAEKQADSVGRSISSAYQGEKNRQGMWAAALADSGIGEPVHCKTSPPIWHCKGTGIFRCLHDVVGLFVHSFAYFRIVFGETLNAPADIIAGQALRLLLSHPERPKYAASLGEMTGHGAHEEPGGEIVRPPERADHGFRPRA